MDFSSGAVLKNPPASTGEAGDMDLIPGTRKIPWSRKWQPSVVFLPAKFHEQRSKESDTTEHKNTKIQIPLYRWPLVIILYLTDPSFLHCYLFLILFLTRVYFFLFFLKSVFLKYCPDILFYEVSGNFSSTLRNLVYFCMASKSSFNIAL